MYITHLEAESFMRLHAVTLDLLPEGGLIEVCGDNAQGKTSTLDAIWCALGGAKASPEQPIHQGRQSAQVSLRVGDLTVTRRFTPKGSTLTVVGSDGVPKRGPQQILDELYSSLAFDPLAFMAQDERKQAETLRKLVGLDFSDLEQRRADVYAERTAVNKAVQSSKHRLDMAPFHPEAGLIEVSVAALSSELRSATEEIRANDIERNRLTGLRNQLATQRREAAEVEQRIKELQERLASVRAGIATAESRETMQAELVAGLVDPDTSAITAKIEAAETTNRHVRENREREALAEEHAANKTHADGLTADLEAIDAEKLARLSAARFPVEGLSVDGDVVTLNRVPLTQASSAERIKACLAISAALKPKLHVILVREGSFLDKHNLRVVADWARENGYQVFMERVAERPEGHGVLIVDGRVAGA